MAMKQLCTVGLDYLGLPPEELSIDWSAVHECSYFNQVEDDTDHPSERARVCGNCTHYVIMEVKNGQ